jgi:hypothetical protein
MAICQRLLNHSFGFWLSAAFACTTLFAGCAIEQPTDKVLLSNTHIRLMDWHISGFGIINSPVAWVLVTNNNLVPITDIVLEYTTFDYEGHQLDVGTCPIVDANGVPSTLQPGEAKNFIELYLGLVDLQTEQLKVECYSVRAAR